VNPSPACLALLRHFEGLRLEAYPDPASGGEPWTIGYGHTGGVLPGERCSVEDAERWLANDAQSACTAVEPMVRVPLHQHELDALTSFVFNLGATRLWNSTLLAKLNKGDRQGAADQFLRWNRGGGRVMPGLVARREAERRMFLGLDWRGSDEPT
jgi:lysozyme